MRHAAEERLAQQPGFHSVAAPAEHTTLPGASVDLVAAGQAFHWFDAQRARAEFARILRPNGFVALFWNTRSTDATPFLRDYERLLQRYSIDYAKVDHRNVGPEILAPFFAGAYRTHVFPSAQALDFEGLRGRLLSSSYAPMPDHPNHPPMLEELKRIFAEHQTGGRVRFEYGTELFLGRVSP
jgi:SAM-dependent methyltransferase